MKKILLFAGLLISLGAAAQVGSQPVTVNQPIILNKWAQLGKYTTATLPSAASCPRCLLWNQDSLKFGTSNGTAWVYPGTGTGSSIPRWGQIIDTITKQTDLINLLNKKVNYTDTASMLAAYIRAALAVRLTDTANMLLPYLRATLGVKYTDTGTMLSPYLRTALFTPGGIGLGNLLNSRQIVNMGGWDSGAVYAHLAGFPAASVGPTFAYAVDSQAFYYNNRTGYTKIGTTGSGGGSGIDSTLMLSVHQALLTYVPLTSFNLTGISTAQGYTSYNATNPAAYISGNQNITITPAGDIKGKASGSTAINPTDTVTGLLASALPSLVVGNLRYNGSNWIFDNTHYLVGADTVNLSTLIALRLKLSDTAAMLSPYLRSAVAAATYATLGSIAGKVNVSDTAAMLSAYLRSALGMKYTDSAAMLSAYLRSALAASTYATITNLALKKDNTDSVNQLTGYTARGRLRQALDSIGLLIGTKGVTRVGPLDSLARVAQGMQIVNNTILGQSVNNLQPGWMTPALFLELDSLYTGKIKSKVTLSHAGGGLWNSYSSLLGDTLIMKNDTISRGLTMITRTDSSRQFGIDFSIMADLSTAQTFTNKIFKSPVINLGSDVTGDMYYRNSSGLLTRLPIGTTKQTIHAVGGIPAWVDTSASGGGSQTLSQALSALADTLKLTGGSTVTIPGYNHSTSGLVTSGLASRLDSIIWVMRSGHGHSLVRAPYTMDSLVFLGLDVKGTGVVSSTFIGTAKDSLAWQIAITPGTNGWVLQTIAGAVVWNLDSTYINAQQWGLVPDGVTDNTANWNTFVNYLVTNKRKGFIPKGKYLFTSTSDAALVNGKTGSLYLQGEGMGTELLKTSKTGALVDIINSSIDGLIFRDIYWHGTHDTTSIGDNAILLQGFNPTRIKNIHINGNKFEGFSQPLTYKGVIGMDVSFNTFLSPLGHDNKTTTNVPAADLLSKVDSAGDANVDVSIMYNIGDGWSSNAATRLSTPADNFVYGPLFGNSFVGFNYLKNYGQEYIDIQAVPGMVDSSHVTVQGNQIDARLKAGSLVLNTATKKTGNYGIRADAPNQDVIDNVIRNASLNGILSIPQVVQYHNVIRNNRISMISDSNRTLGQAIYAQGVSTSAHSMGTVIADNTITGDSLFLKQNLTMVNVVFVDSAKVMNNPVSIRKVVKNGFTVTNISASGDSALYVAGNIADGMDVDFFKTNTTLSAAQTSTAGQIINGFLTINDGTQCNGCVPTSDANGKLHFAVPSTGGSVTSVGMTLSIGGFLNTSTANPSTTPFTTIGLVAAPAASVWGSVAGGAPVYFTPSLTSALFANQGTPVTVLHGNNSGNPTWAPFNYNTDGTGTIQATNFPALTGIIKTVAGSLTTTMDPGTIINSLIANNTIDLPTKVTGILPPANGGTGANNGSNIFTMAGSVTFAGAFPFIGTLTGSTSIIFPTSGTLLANTGNGSGLSNIVQTLTGTPNEILVNNTGTAWTIAGPQPLGTTNAPTFSGLNLTGLAAGAGTDGILSISGNSVRNTPISAFISATVANAFTGWQSINSTGTDAITKSNVNFTNSTGITVTLQTPTAVDGQPFDVDFGNTLNFSAVTLTLTTSAGNGMVYSATGPGATSISFGALQAGTHIHGTHVGVSGSGTDFWYISKY